MITRQIPYRCPVCGGSGESSTRPLPNEKSDKCHACNGAGIIYGTETIFIEEPKKDVKFPHQQWK